MDQKWTKSESIGNLVLALAAAQLKFDPVLKDSDNPAYKGSKYADLPTIVNATRKHLAEQGLCVIQMPSAQFGEGDAKMITVTTMLAHSSGEWIASDLTMPAFMRDRFDAQSAGSAVTYAKRYAMQAMLDVAADIDDDGNSASGVGSKEAATVVGLSKLGKIPPVELVPWKGNAVVIRGDGAPIIKTTMTAAEKAKFTITFDNDAKGYTIPASQAHAFASICGKYKVPCEFAESGAANRQPEP